MFGFLMGKIIKILLTINNARAKLRTKGNYTKERSFLWTTLTLRCHKPTPLI